MKMFIAGILIFAGLPWLAGCGRAAPESSRIALQLPTYDNDGLSGKATLQAATPGISACSVCLKQIIVNVDGADFKTISLVQKQSDPDEDGTQLSSQIELEVPGGTQRRIQILALYKNPEPEGGIRVQYGQATVDLLSAEPPPIYMTLASVGQFRGGSITGRYLTGAGTGPTGKVNIEFRHPATGIPVEIGGGEILNGWFSFFGSSSADFPLTYRLAETGQTLFAEATTETLRRDVPYIAHVRTPSSYFRQEGTGPYVYREARGENFVYGFFGPGADTANQKICVYGSSADLTRVFRDNTGTYALNYSYGGSADLTGTVYATGGKGHNSLACASYDLSSARSFDSDIVALQFDQFDGKGNDHARALEGAFSYFSQYDAGQVKSVVKRFKVGSNISALQYSLKVLPGLFTANGGSLFSGVGLFRKADGASDLNRRGDCRGTWLAEHGYTAVPAADFVSAPVVNASGDLTFRLAGLQTGDEAYVACPLDSAGRVNGLGGLYIGSLGETVIAGLAVSPGGYNFSVSPGGTYTKDFTVTNQGPVPAEITLLTAVTGGTASAGFVYSFTMNNGSCPGFLQPGASCQFQITFSAANPGTFSNGLMLVNYFNGRESSSVPLSIGGASQ